MIEQLFKSEPMKLQSMEPVNYGFGSMTLDLPKLDERNIISQINDANQIAYFGTLETPIKLKISEGKADTSKSNYIESIIFEEGYAYSSLLKAERDEGVYYLSLKDNLKKDWVFKLKEDSILSCNVELDLNFHSHQLGA